MHLNNLLSERVPPNAKVMQAKANPGQLQQGEASNAQNKP
jgi:hypothetical protein